MQKEYNVNELYSVTVSPIIYKAKLFDVVGSVRPVKSKSYKTICIKLDSVMYLDVINNVKYKGFYELLGDLDWINGLGEYYVHNVVPLFKKFNIHEERISKDELIFLYNKLNWNNLQKIERKRSSVKKYELEVKNPFLKQVVDVRSKISEDMIPTEKDKYIKKLNDIASEYSTTMIEKYEELKSNPKCEMEILNKYLDLLTELEGEIEKANELSTFSTNMLEELEILNDTINSSKGRK